MSIDNIWSSMLYVWPIPIPLNNNDAVNDDPILMVGLT